MNESDWRASDDPRAMLRWVTEEEQTPQWQGRRFVSDRKLRLFAVACCRRVWGQLSPKDREVVTRAEGFADGDGKLLLKARPLAATRDSIENCFPGVTPEMAVGFAVACAATTNAREAAEETPEWLAKVIEFPRMSALLREIVGNPWRPVPLPWVQDPPINRELHPPYCPWLTPAVLKVAGAIYQDRDWSALPILADALEEAGCAGRLEEKRDCEFCNGTGCFRTADSPPEKERCEFCGGTGIAQPFIPHPLLAHLRSPGPHVRGCWALDLILGKE